MFVGAALLLIALVAPPQLVRQEAYEQLTRTRFFIQFELWEEAICVADDLIAKYPHAVIAREARFLRHQAQLYKALDLVRADPPLKTAARLVRSLEAIAREPMDEAVVAAKLALATVHYRAATGVATDGLVADAVAGWKALDTLRIADPPRLAYGADVIAIRNLVFEPFGGGVFANDPRWSGVAWARRGTPFLFVNPVIRVWVDADLPPLRLVAYHPFPSHSDVVFLDAERRLLLDRVITRLGSAKPQPWMGKGAARDVLAFWADAGVITRGRLGGWMYEAYPFIRSIEFVDPRRNMARVKVSVAYAGATIWLEKRNGAWVVTSVRDFWIS
jgi:hypothetical protein